MALEIISNEGVLGKRISKTQTFSINLISDSLITSNFTLMSTGHFIYI